MSDPDLGDVARDPLLSAEAWVTAMIRGDEATVDRMAALVTPALLEAWGNLQSLAVALREEHIVGLSVPEYAVADRTVCYIQLQHDRAEGDGYGFLTMVNSDRLDQWLVAGVGEFVPPKVARANL